jgi:predicted nucleic acid-binding protein
MPVLVDTNILVRAVQRNHPLMDTARLALRSLVQNGEELCVTWQNIAEFWNVCTRPADVNGLGNSIAATDRLTSRIEMFFTVLPDSPESVMAGRRPTPAERRSCRLATYPLDSAHFRIRVCFGSVSTGLGTARPGAWSLHLCRISHELRKGAWRLPALQHGFE